MYKWLELGKVKSYDYDLSFRLINAYDILLIYIIRLGFFWNIIL